MRFLLMREMASQRVRIGSVLLTVIFSGLVSAPDEIHCTPSESGAESGENHLVALLELVLVFVEADGYAGGAGVAIVLNVDEHLLRGNAQTAAYSLDDSKVGLMRNEPVD